MNISIPSALAAKLRQHLDRPDAELVAMVLASMPEAKLAEIGAKHIVELIRAGAAPRQPTLFFAGPRR